MKYKNSQETQCPTTLVWGTASTAVRVRHTCRHSLICLLAGVIHLLLLHFLFFFLTLHLMPSNFFCKWYGAQWHFFMNPFALRLTQFPSNVHASTDPLQNYCRIGEPLTCAWRWRHQVTAGRCDDAKAECSSQDLRLAQMDTFRVLSALDMGTKLKRHRFHSP